MIPGNFDDGLANYSTSHGKHGPGRIICKHDLAPIVVDDDVPFDRAALLEEFRANEIDGRVFFWPLSMLPMFEAVPTNHVSYGLFGRAVNLPTYHDLRDDEIARVSAIVRRRIQRMAA